jgi:hypothetical protein
LFVPPGFKFQEFFRVVLPADFSNHDLEEYKRASAFLNLFQPELKAIGKAGNLEESEVKMWIEQVEKIFIKALVNNNLLDANREFDEDFMYYVEVNEPDLIMIIEKHLGVIQSIFKKELVIKLSKLKKTPILFLYSPKQK